MSKELQREILKIFYGRKDEYILNEDQIVHKINLLYKNKFINSGLKENKTLYNNQIQKQIKLLLDDESLIETENKNHYRLTEWGELRAGGNYVKRFWYWLIYRKHNLAVLIAILSLIISIITLLHNNQSPVLH